MKELYYRFLLLLLKPFWHLALSIIIIIIIRIFFIKIVYADMDIHLYEKFKTGYYSEINPLGEVFVYNPVGELVGTFESTEEYRKAIDIPIEIKPYPSRAIVDNGNQSAEPEYLMPIKRSLTYAEIITNIETSITESRTTTQLAKNMIYQIRNIIPSDVWASSIEEFLGESKIEYYLENFRKQEFNSKTAIAREIFCSTVTANNILILLGQENNIPLMESLILRRLECDGFHLELLFPHIKNINQNVVLERKLYFETMQQIQDMCKNPVTIVGANSIYPADIMQSISEIITRSHNKSDLVIRVMQYIEENVPQHVLATQWEDFNNNSAYLEFINYFMNNIPQQTQYQQLVAHVFYRGVAVYSATMIQEKELSLEMLTDIYFSGLEESAGSDITKKLEIYLSDFEKT